VCLWAKLPSLQDKENNSTDNRYEVQQKIHEISNDCLGRESREWLLHKLPEAGHGISARLQVAAFGDDICLALFDQSLWLVSWNSHNMLGKTYAIKRVKQRILDKEGTRYQIGDCRTLTKHEHDRREYSQRSVEDG
jgi:hypothetical protein